MSGSALIVSGVVAQMGDVFDIAITEAHYKARRQRAAKKWGLGCEVSIRIEPADEAIKYHQLKHLYGHLFAPVANRSGETKAEVAVRMKVAYMPDDGRTSLTQLNYEELKSFTESVEQDIRENEPEAWEDCLAVMALYDRQRSA